MFKSEVRTTTLTDCKQKSSEKCISVQPNLYNKTGERQFP